MAKTNKEAKIKRLVDILRSHGIEMSVAACGCCQSPWVSFSYRGERILMDEEDCIFSTKKGNKDANVL